MVTYRTLSGFLADVLTEAKRLLELKAEFGRLPDGELRNQAIWEIDHWFSSQGVSRRITAEEDLSSNLGYDPNTISVPEGRWARANALAQTSDDEDIAF
jgi:hypothetical protein